MIQIDMKKSAETTLDGEYSTVMAELTASETLEKNIRKKHRMKILRKPLSFRRWTARNL